MDALWRALELAITREGDQLTKRLQTPPWESSDKATRDAWSALTAPRYANEHRQRLKGSLNDTARRLTERAVMDCMRVAGQLVAGLEGELSTLPGAAALDLRQQELGGLVRLRAEASYPPQTRYIRFTPLVPDARIGFELLWGQFSYGRAPGHFDGRSFGDLSYSVACARAWLLEGCDWKQIPPPPRPSADSR